VEQFLHVDARGERGAWLWREPAAWLREKQLGRSFWVFFSIAFFFDLGFAVYFFLFSLYLLDLHFTERSIGLIVAAVSLGSVVGTLPAGFVARRIGLRPLLLACLVAAPMLGGLRLLFVEENAQVALAFVHGLAMCLWGVCFLPSVARATTEENRTSAFSLVFSVGVGTSMVGGLLCGYLPQWLRSAGFILQPGSVKRLILFAGCGAAALALIPLLRMAHAVRWSETPAEEHPCPAVRPRRGRLHPFLLRFLPAMMLWTAVQSSFSPFANVYLSRKLHVPLLRIGMIYSAAQVLQFCAGLAAPLLFRALGIVRGVVGIQIATGAAMVCLGATRTMQLAVPLYIGFSVVQWMSGPGLYNLLMSAVPDQERSLSSAMTLFCNALAGAAATAATGVLLTRFGYERVLFGCGMLAVAAGVLFQVLVGSSERQKIGPL
jgi:MFS family permease